MKTFGTVGAMVVQRSGKPEMTQVTALTDPTKPLVVTQLFTLPENDQTPQYTVTHVQSGMKIGVWKKVAPAKRALAKLLPIADWTADQMKIVSFKIGEQVHAILVEEKGLQS